VEIGQTKERAARLPVKNGFGKIKNMNVQALPLHDLLPIVPT
jgi:hypothetical protein